MTPPPAPSPFVQTQPVDSSGSSCHQKTVQQGPFVLAEGESVAYEIRVASAPVCTANCSAFQLQGSSRGRCLFANATSAALVEVPCAGEEVRPAGGWVDILLAPPLPC